MRETRIAFLPQLRLHFALMDTEIDRRTKACDAARNPEWDSVVMQAEKLGKSEKAYIRMHPPGLVGALWTHFAATRDKCGCETVGHEREDCAVRLIERILRDEEAL